MIETKKLKIAIISPILGEAYGQERAVRDSVKLLRAAGHQVFFVVEKVQWSINENEGYTVIGDLFDHHTLSSPGLVRGITMRTLGYLRQINPDVVHIIDQPGFRVVSAIQANYPTVVTSHTVATTCPASTRSINKIDICQQKSGWECLPHNRRYGCLDQFKGNFRRAHSVQNYLLRRRVLMRCDVSIAVSHYLQNLLLADGWDRKKVRLIFNAVEIPATHNLLPREDTHLILCGARLVKGKGINFLLHALKKIEHLKWNLCLCGDGEGRGEIGALADQLGIKDRVTIMGAVAYDLMTKLMNSCRVVVQPSLAPEAFGLTVAEACAVGKPVVAFNVPAINEIIHHEKNGLLAERANVDAFAHELSRVLTQDDLCQKLGAEGKKIIARDFSPGRHLRDTLHAYQDAMIRFRASKNTLTENARAGAPEKTISVVRRRRKKYEPLRIVMFSPTLGEAFGQERVMKDSGELLRRAGHKVYFLGDLRRGRVSFNHGLKLIKGISSLHFLSNPGRVASAKREMMEFLSSIKPHVVHFIDQFDHRLMQAVCDEYPVVLTSHTMATTCPSSCRLTYSGDGACREKSGRQCLTLNKRFHCLDDFKNDFRRFHAIENYLLRRKALEKVNFVLAISRYVESALVADGWDKGKVRLVYNPIEIYPPSKSSRPDLPENLLVCASRLVPYKGVNILIEAMSALRDKKWTLWVCGEGPGKEMLMARTRALNLQERIFFKGSLPYGEMKETIAASYALIQPNIGPEPFGLSVAEASGMGVPVITSDVAALNEIVDHGVNGLLFQSGNSDQLSRRIGEMLDQPELREALSKQGPPLIQRRFSPEAHLKQTLNIYEQCVRSMNTDLRLPRDQASLNF